MADRDQHLDAILRKLDALLALAEKRTPGEWVLFAPTGEKSLFVYPFGREKPFAICDNIGWNDAAYIAACSNAAEAGWRATRYAIHGLRSSLALAVENGEALSVINIGAALDAIRAQWPEHTLK